MKIKFIAAIALLFFGTMGFAQSENIDKEIKQGMSELSEMLESLDLNKILNEDLFAEIEKIKPSEKQFGEMQSMMEQSLKAVENIDFSVFDDLFKEMEKAIEDIKMPSDSSTPTKKSQSKPSKGKRI